MRILPVRDMGDKRMMTTMMKVISYEFGIATLSGAQSNT